MSKKGQKTLRYRAKIKSASIVIGAVLACIAPFIHMLIPKKSEAIIILEERLELGKVSQAQFEIQYPILKEKQKYLGFSSPRRFWYAIGLPITLFIFANLFLILIDVVRDPSIRYAIRFAGLILLFISVFHLIWVVWPGQDFPVQLYYFAIFLMSFASVILALILLNHRRSLRSKIKRLVRFISVDAYEKYIKEEDEDDYLDDSFAVYDEITK